MGIEAKNQNRIEVVRNQLVVPVQGTLFRGEGAQLYQDILDRSRGGRFLIVSAHPDDDFASAGLRARLSGEFKMTPDMAVFTMGEGGEDMRTTRIMPSHMMRGMREEELWKASEVMGISTVYFFGEKDGQVKPREDLAYGLATVIRKVRPDLMIVPSGDPREHPDHIAVYEISKRARLLAAHNESIDGSSTDHPFYVPLLVEEEIMHINPDRFPNVVDTTTVQGEVTDHRGSYTTQLAHSPRYIRFFDLRAGFHGGQIGTERAEAFHVSNGELRAEDFKFEMPKYHPVAHPQELRLR